MGNVKKDKTQDLSYLDLEPVIQRIINMNKEIDVEVFDNKGNKRRPVKGFYKSTSDGFVVGVDPVQ